MAAGPATFCAHGVASDACARASVWDARMEEGLEVNGTARKRNVQMGKAQSKRTRERGGGRVR